MSIAAIHEARMWIVQIVVPSAIFIASVIYYFHDKKKNNKNVVDAKFRDK